MSETIQLDDDGVWRPAIPEPFYVAVWRWRFFPWPWSWHSRCECGQMYADRDDYRLHWRRKHGSPMPKDTPPMTQVHRRLPAALEAKVWVPQRYEWSADPVVWVDDLEAFLYGELTPCSECGGTTWAQPEAGPDESYTRMPCPRCNGQGQVRGAGLVERVQRRIHAEAEATGFPPEPGSALKALRTELSPETTQEEE